jgi:hypothetical protein
MIKNSAQMEWQRNNKAGEPELNVINFVRIGGYASL